MTETSQTREASRLTEQVTRLAAWCSAPTTFEYPLVDDVNGVLAALSEAGEQNARLVREAEGRERASARFRKEWKSDDLFRRIDHLRQQLAGMRPYDVEDIATLQSRCLTAEAERDTALARIAGMEAGEPVAWQRRMRNIEVEDSHPFAVWSPWKGCSGEQASYVRQTGGKVFQAPELEAEVRPLFATPAAALARAERAEAESWHQPLLPAEFHWPTGNFSVHDPEPENHHSALYLVMPDGLMVNVSGNAREGVDIARANWMADVLNTALSRDLVRAALSPAPTVKGEGE